MKRFQCHSTLETFMLVLVAMQLQGVPEKVTTLGYWVTFLGHPVQALGQGLL